MGNFESLSLLGGDNILQGFGWEGLDNLLSRDLDGGTGLGVAADTGLAGPNLDGYETGDCELVPLFDSLAGQFAKFGEDYSGLLFGDCGLRGELGDDLRFGHGHGLNLLLKGKWT